MMDLDQGFVLEVGANFVALHVAGRTGGGRCGRQCGRRVVADAVPVGFGVEVHAGRPCNRVVCVLRFDGQLLLHLDG